MRVLICGARDLPVGGATRMRQAVDAFVRVYQPAYGILVHGDCPGVDREAAKIALARGWNVVPYPAEWDRLGRSAGPLRNQRMLDEGRPDLVLAFHTDPGLGLGTRDMVRRARAAGVPVEIIMLSEPKGGGA